MARMRWRGRDAGPDVERSGGAPVERPGAASRRNTDSSGTGSSDIESRGIQPGDIQPGDIGPVGPAPAHPGDLAPSGRQRLRSRLVAPGGPPSRRPLNPRRAAPSPPDAGPVPRIGGEGGGQGPAPRPDWQADSIDDDMGIAEGPGMPGDAGLPGDSSMASAFGLADASIAAGVGSDPARAGEGAGLDRSRAVRAGGGVASPPGQEAGHPGVDSAAAVEKGVRERPAQDGPARAEPTLGRSTSVLAAGTFLSRLSGFARVIVVVPILGISNLGDAYTIANSIPNIIYDLLLGGILSATLIPVFVDEMRHDDPRERDRAISAILSTAAAALLVLTVALFALAPLVIHFYLPAHDAAEIAVGTSLLRYFAPQVFFLGAIVLSTALLNARRQFAAAAFSPVANNLIAIGALVATDVVAHSLDLAAFRHDHGGLLLLGLGTTFGYVVQLLVQLPAMARSEMRLRPLWAPRHAAVRRVVRLSAWLLGVVLANQVSYNLILVFAGKTGKGDLIAFQTAYQFFQLPYALFAVSIASAIMPDLAERWAARQWTAFMARVISGLRVTIALLVPAGVGYAFVAAPVVYLALHHETVNSSKAQLIAQMLTVFALGLPGFSAFLPLVRALQAMKQTRTMFEIYALENALSVVLAVILYRTSGATGLAAAFIAPYTVAAIVAAVYLHRKVGALGGVYTGRSIARTLVATGVMAIVLLVVKRVVPTGISDPLLLVRLVAEVAAGTLAYLLMARWLGIEDLQPVLRIGRSVLGRAGLRR
jgi:putative peptidoglycan lipid II flippase